MDTSERYIYEDLRKVDSINSYAVQLGYLTMAIKGLGFLVLTWTTVVLLGGFVSTLHKSDFWSLTFITLVQTAGIFDVDLNKKLGSVMFVIIEQLGNVFEGVKGSSDSVLYLWVRLPLAYILVSVQVLLLATVLCPLAIIYVFGILMSGGISLWRLIERGYRGSDGESSNLPAAMDTLYYLAVIQCVLFCYRFVLGRTGKRFAKGKASTGNDLEKQVFSRYLRETKKGCEKDPLFAEGRHLSTHAIDMIGSDFHMNSPFHCIYGVEMLYTSICSLERIMKKMQENSNTPELFLFFGRMEMKRLVRAATSSGEVLQKLLEMLDPKDLSLLQELLEMPDPKDLSLLQKRGSRETRKQAAKIVECLASNINLEQFPRGFHYISLLIGTLQEYSLAHPFQQGWEYRGEHEQAYKELLLQGLCIIRELASSENNCRVISDTQYLVSKIMAPITSDLLHHTIDDHGEWSDIVEKSVEVMSQFTGAPGEAGAKLRHDISRCEEAISTLQRILSCNKCNEELQQRAIQILTRLFMDTTEGSKAADSVLNKESSSREDFVRMLVHIFTSDDKYNSSVRGFAGVALSEICCRGGISNATIAMQTSGDVVDALTQVFVHDKSKICKQAAAEILKHLCTHCTYSASPSAPVVPSSPAAVQSVRVSTTIMPLLISPSPPPRHDYLGKLSNEILKVLGEILCSGDEKQKGNEADRDGLAKQKSDIESQSDNGRGKGISSPSSSHPQKDEHGEQEKESVRSANLLSSLLSLFAEVYHTTFLGDLPPHLDASSFLNMLNEVLLKKSNHHTVENLLLFKAIAKMVIGMMKHNGNRYLKQEDLECLLELLYGAWRNIVTLDYSMIFSYASSSATTSSKLDRCTLASLLKEAADLLIKMRPTSVSG